MINRTRNGPGGSADQLYEHVEGSLPTSELSTPTDGGFWASGIPHSRSAFSSAESVLIMGVLARAGVAAPAVLIQHPTVGTLLLLLTPGSQNREDICCYLRVLLYC